VDRRSTADGSSEMSQSFPLVFKFEDVVAGDGFVARVLAFGRALLVQEEDGDFFVYGVTPGAVAGGGTERSEALSAFKKSYLTVLFDLAAETSDAVAFEEQVRGFFYESCDDLNGAWQEARERVLAGEIELDVLGRVPAELFPPQVTLLVSSPPTAQANPQHEDTYFLPRAA
jgi:hypothetical protein